MRDFAVNPVPVPSQHRCKSFITSSILGMCDHVSITPPPPAYKSYRRAATPLLPGSSFFFFDEEGVSTPAPTPAPSPTPVKVKTDVGGVPAWTEDWTPVIPEPPKETQPIDQLAQMDWIERANKLVSAITSTAPAKMSVMNGDREALDEEYHVHGMYRLTRPDRIRRWFASCWCSVTLWWNGLDRYQTLLLNEPVPVPVATSEGEDRRLMHFLCAQARVLADVRAVSLINTSTLIPFEVNFESNLLAQLTSIYPHWLPPPNDLQIHSITNSISKLMLPGCTVSRVVDGTIALYWHERRCAKGLADFREGPPHHH